MLRVVASSESTSLISVSRETPPQATSSKSRTDSPFKEAEGVDNSQEKRQGVADKLAVGEGILGLATPAGARGRGAGSAGAGRGPARRCWRASRDF